MEIIWVFGVAVFAAVLSFIFKELKKEYSVMIMIAAGIIITLWGLAKIYPVVDYLYELTDSSNISEYFSVIMKVLGISFIVQIGADICRDFGETSLASKIEFAGKAVILAAVLPLLRSVISMSIEMLA